MPGDELADGAYDALVVDATDVGDAISLELTILAGSHKGEIVTVRAAGLAVDPLDLLGIPATLTVRDGQPAVSLEP
jgi:hypothetical protein